MKMDNQTYQKIEALIKEGRYASTETFVELAVRNQLLLETEGKVAAVRYQSAKDTQDPDRPQLSIPPQELQPFDASPLNEKIAIMPLWGQVNRLAPAKLVLRSLMNNLAGSDARSTDLKRFSAEVAEDATEFRMFSKKKDKADRVRGTELYVAFPKRDPSSQQRFLNYYVGKAPLRKWIDSVLTGLSFANIKLTDEGAVVIGPTAPGLKFARMHSPLIDDFFLDGKQIASSFSDEERSFLIEHIKSTRTGEYNFLLFTLTSIVKGADTPTKLKDRVSELVRGKDLGFKFSEKVATTMQVGVTGRLLELGLLTLEKQGQKSRYVISEKGEKLIGKL